MSTCCNYCTRKAETTVKMDGKDVSLCGMCAAVYRASRTRKKPRKKIF